MKPFLVHLSVCLLTSGSALSGCAEVEYLPARDASSADSTTRDTGSQDVVTSDTNTPRDVLDGMVDAGLSPVVINELQATGNEFIELFNPGTVISDLSGQSLADEDTDGGPRTARAMHFPTGTIVPPGGYLYILTNVNDAGAGFQTLCGDAGPTSCFHAGFGLSNSNGDSVYLLDPGNRVVNSVRYPAMGAPSGQSYSRIPNATGPFVPAQPTPGRPNMAL